MNMDENEQARMANELPQAASTPYGNPGLGQEGFSQMSTTIWQA